MKKWVLIVAALFTCSISYGQATGNESIGNSSIVGHYTIQVKSKASEDDGYWTWYVNHVSDVRQYNKKLVETRIQLVVLASEISRAKATRFELAKMRMEWLVAKDESIEFAGLDLGSFFSSAITQTARVGPKARKANQLHSTKLGNQVRAGLQQQQQLIDGITKSHSLILTRAERQLEKSGDGRLKLVKELERLNDEHKLLPLYLYDYAAWYEPDKLPKLINDFVAKEKIDQGLKNLLIAKAKIADAQDLEQKAFSERLRPTSDNYQRLLFAMATFKGDPLGYISGRTEVNKILKNISNADVFQITSQTQRLDAIALLRENLRTNPNDATAKALLVQQELYWLKRIAQKIEGQHAMAMSAFANYLTARGFDPIDREGWIPWMKDYLGAIWGLGIISSRAGYPGIDLPGANAELVGAQLMEAARSRMALVALIKIVKSGRTLSELKTKNQKELAETMSELWASATPTPTHKKSINKFAVDIYTTLRDLKDLDRLSTDDGDTLEFARDVNDFFAKNYFIPVDSRYQSFEWFGDLLNVHNLVTLWGPGAIVKVNGKWAKSYYMTFAEQDRLQKTGSSLAGLTRTAASQILDNQNIMVMGYNLDTIGETIRKTRSVRMLAKAHALGTQSIIQGTALTGLLAESSKLVAGFFLNTAITEIAKSTGIPGAAIITEILMSYEVPHGLYDHLVFQSPSIPLTSVIEPLKRYQKQAQLTRRRVTQINETIQQADELLDVASRQTLEASNPAGGTPSTLTDEVTELGETMQRRQVERLNAIAAEVGAPPITFTQDSRNVANLTTVDAVPQSTVQASEDALASGITALQDGDTGEAQRALEAANTLSNTAKTEADQVVNRVTTAIDQLESARPVAIAVDQSHELPNSAVVPLGERDIVPPLIDPSHYDIGIAGEKLRLADEAGLRGEDLDAGLAHLDDAMKYADEMDESSGALEAAINQRKNLLANAQGAKGILNQRRAETHVFPALDEITDEELKLVLTKLKNGEFKPTTSRSNPAIEVSINGRTFRLKPKQESAKAEAEVVGGAIAELLGLDTPATTTLDGNGLTINLNGETVPLGKMVLSRQIDDFVPISELDEATLLAIRLDYADQRVLRAFLADSDGHMGNIGLGPNGKLWVIDTDLANLDSVPVLRQASNLIDVAEFSNQSDLVEAAVGFAHGWLPEGVNLGGAITRFLASVKQHPLYRWIARADQMISYRDMKDMVDRIAKLVSSESLIVEKLVSRGLKRERAKEIFKILKQRSEILEDVLSKPSLFGGKAIEMSSINDLQLIRFTRRNVFAGYSGIEVAHFQNAA